METFVITDNSKGLVKLLTGKHLQEVGGFPELKGVEFFRGTMRKSRGVSSFSLTSLIGAPLVLDQYVRTTGENWLMCVTEQNLYRFNITTRAFDLIGPYAGSAGRSVSSAILNDLFIFTDSESPIRRYDGATLANLGGSPPRAKTVTPFWSFLILGGTVEAGITHPFRIRWSDVGRPEVWTGGLSGFIDLVETPDWLMSAASIMDRLYVYKERSVWEMVYVGLPKIFDLAKIVDGVGLLAAGTLESLGTGHLFLGNDNVYIFAGRELEPVGDAIRPLLFGSNALTNQGALAACRGVYVEEEEEYWLFVPTGIDSIPFQAFRYQMTTKSWWPRRLTHPAYCVGVWYTDTTRLWDGLTGTWAEQGWRWGDPTMVAAFPLTLVGTLQAGAGRVQTIDPTVVTDEGVVIESVVETPDLMFGPKTRFLGFWLEAEGGLGIESFWSTDEGRSWVSLGHKPVPADWGWMKWSLNTTAESLRFRVRLDSADIAVRKFVVLYEPRRV